MTLFLEISYGIYCIFFGKKFKRAGKGMVKLYRTQNYDNSDNYVQSLFILMKDPRLFPISQL